MLCDLFLCQIQLLFFACVCMCVQEGQQHGEGGDQSVPGEQEDLSGSGGTSYRLVATRTHDTVVHLNCFCCEHTHMLSIVHICCLLNVGPPVKM